MNIPVFYVPTCANLPTDPDIDLTLLWVGRQIQVIFVPEVYVHMTCSIPVKFCGSNLLISGSLRHIDALPSRLRISGLPDFPVMRLWELTVDWGLAFPQMPEHVRSPWIDLQNSTPWIWTCALVVCFWITQPSNSRIPQVSHFGPISCTADVQPNVFGCLWS
jgi:hypothetical protein